MRFRVVGVAVPGAVVNRDRAVAGDGQREKDLLEVGPMVLVVAEDRLDRGLAALLASVSLAIPAGDGDRGGVVVKTIEVDLEAVDRAQDDLGHERGALRVEQPVERAPDAVVVEARRLSLGQAEQRGLHAGGPFRVAVHRLAVVQDDIAQKHSQRASRRDAPASGDGLRGDRRS